MGGCHGAPELRSDASGLGQVSIPGSPGPGVVYQRHSDSPVSAFTDSRNPRVGPLGLSPPIPTRTCFRTTIGADVDQFATPSVVSLCAQRSLPVDDSSETT